MGTSTGGSVEIYPGPRGDCNSSRALSVADLVADALEIFDADGTFWVDVLGSTYVGSPVGCDANADTVVNAADISCTILLVFGQTCGPPPGSLRDLGGQVKAAPRAPLLWVNGDRRRAAGATAWVPVRLKRGQDLASLVFSLDLDPDRLRFDPTDRDGDGTPDAVRFPAGSPPLTHLRFAAGDPGGELDVGRGDDQLIRLDSQAARSVPTLAGRSLETLAKQGDCTPSDTELCLTGDRFRVEVEWRDFKGNIGSAKVVPLAPSDSGLFYFFSFDNWEMLIKVLDGCGINGRFWVFSAAATNVEYTLRVTDTETGEVKTYLNPLGNLAAAITDTGAFATCP